MKYIFLLFISALFASCFNEGDCLITATNYVRIQFKKKTNNAQDTLVAFAYRSVDISGQIISLHYAPASQLLLPLNTDQNSASTTFILHRIKAAADSTMYATDTLTIGYTKQTKVISKDCGAYTFYQNLKVEHMSNHHDSVAYKSLSTALYKNPSGASSDVNSYALNFQIFY